MVCVLVADSHDSAVLWVCLSGFYGDPIVRSTASTIFVTLSTRSEHIERILQSEIFGISRKHKAWHKKANIKNDNHLFHTVKAEI
ncbi:hypothetical protein F9C07_5676 [Aspergillus flavus]|uniref:Uncharacterized protein n=1 Tax=Aspergillus flavus (strain ATCC 200026 / FGSC A1120 / IAM 13836 / NRRL 3357 / JCM 12722 / SRRC 167) TaxID=332952 RepID=A0A7U2R229_ASPFN|nr:hypothetical protein F9C07_5676 [Aspergillus flavus]